MVHTEVKPHYVVSEEFTNESCEVAYEETVFEGEDILICRQKAIDYCITQLRRFEKDVILTEEGQRSSKGWWLKFEDVEFYESYLFLSTNYGDAYIACADETLERGPLELKQLEALEIETKVLIDARVSR